MLRNVTLSFLSVAIGITLILSGCDAFSNNRAVEGRVQVLLTDNPLDDFAEANVTVRRVELLGTNEAGESTLIVLSEENQSFNLLELQNGVTASLADVDVPVGRYNQVRLVIADEAHILFSDGSAETLKVPSGTQTGIKVIFPHFEIESDDDLYTLTVDFDVVDSFVKAGASGKYIFKPVLKAQAMVANGDEVDVNADDDDDDNDE